MYWLAELRSRLRTALTGIADDPEAFVEMLRPTQDAKFGDFQANCAMSLGKSLKQSPRDVATAIVARLDVADLCEPPEIAGPGFINLRLRTDRLASATLAQLADDRLGVLPVAEPRTIIVDYSSPNVAKPMHVGHLRSTVIGQALDRVLRFLGHRVTSDNHVGDWGTQFGMILYGYKHFRNEIAYRERPVAELARLYRLVNQLSDYHELRAKRSELGAAVTRADAALTAAKAVPPKAGDKDAAKLLKKHEQDLKAAREELESAVKKIDAVDSNLELTALAATHPQIAEQSRQETARLHAGDEENVRLWKEFLPECLAALDQIYQRFGLKFDLTNGESFYNPMLAGIVDELRSKGLAQISQGAVCVFLPDNPAPFLIRKADGAFTYATTDLATIRYRVETLKADTILYVVDARQSEHFQMLFATARLIGFDDIDLRHITFGTVLGDDRKPFKTRAGDTIGLESLLDEGIRRAREIVDANDDAKATPELDAESRAAVAEKVGIGGIIYADLHHNRESDFIFNWDKMLAKTGDTATYIQYAYARVRGIFAKDGIDVDALRRTTSEIRLASPAERQLALQLQRFSEAVNDVVVDYRPNILTQYLFETANVFATFYEHCPVLREPDAATRQSRLALCDLTARVLKQGLELLGIGVAEKM